MCYEIQVIDNGNVTQEKTKLNFKAAQAFLKETLTDSEKTQDLHNKLLEFPARKKSDPVGLVNRAYNRSQDRVVQVRPWPVPAK